MVAPDGTIYINSDAGFLYAINPDGTIKWEKYIPIDGRATLALGKDGSIYDILSEWDVPRVVALFPEGEIKWISSPLPCSLISLAYSVGIGKNEEVYVVPSQGCVSALDSNGNIKWAFWTGYPMMEWAPPISIGEDGSIYIGRGNEIYAISADGTLKWYYYEEVQIPIYFFPPGAVINVDNTIIWSLPTKTIAFNNDGTKKWEIPIGSGDSVRGTPAIGNKGTIYIPSGNVLYAIDIDSGVIKWTFQGEGIYSFTAPVIGKNGIVYIQHAHGGEGSGWLYGIFSSDESLAPSPWPMIYHDQLHSGHK